MFPILHPLLVDLTLLHHDNALYKHMQLSYLSFTQLSRAVKAFAAFLLMALVFFVTNTQVYAVNNQYSSDAYGAAVYNGTPQSAGPEIARTGTSVLSIVLFGTLIVLASILMYVLSSSKRRG